MSTTGNVFPGTAANVDRAGNTAWTNPGNVTSDNATDATVVVPSDYLVTSNYNFSSIPINVAIRGVTVRVEAAESGTGTSFYIAQLHTATTPTLVGNATSNVTVSGATPVISTNGGIADLWGTTLTAAQVKDTGFGVSIWSTDTINTLLIDFVTIAIEWTDVPQAWTPVRSQRRRKNSTNRRLPSESLVLTSSAPAEPSDDRALGEPFRTVSLRSRRALSIGWMAALTAQATAVPVSAWIASTPKRRRETERRLVDIEPLHWPYIAPELGVIPAPKAIRIEWRYVLRRVEPLEYYPPPTGPPPTAQNWPAWALPEASYRSSWQRRLLSVPEHETYPATPAQASNDRALEAPFVTRTIRSRRLLQAPALPFVAPAQAPQAQPLPAWALPVANRRSDGERKALRAEGPPATNIAPSQAPLPAWALPLANYRPSHRTHRRVAELNSYPATPVQGAQPISAVTPQRKVKRRKHRQGLFLSGGGVVEARVQPQFPSWDTRPTKRRKGLERRLLRADGIPSAPATPAVAAQPVTAWQQPKQHWIERARKLQPAAPQITYPATPPVPESAWRAPRQFWKDQARKLQPAAPQITYPRTNVSDVATLPVLAIKRRETQRTLRTAEHAPLYTQTPVAFQQPTSWKLAEAFRRHGWRTLRKVLDLDERPETPNQSEPKPNRTVKVKTNRTHVTRAPSRTAKATAPKRTEKP